MQLETFISVEIFLKELEAGLDDLTEAMRTQTGRAAYYGAKYIQAQKQAKIVAQQVAQIEGKLMQKHRKALEDEARAEVDGTNKSPTRVTADIVKAAVATDPLFITANRIKIDADEIEGICRVAYDAFKTRRDMLSSSAYLKGAELKSNTIIQGAREATAGYHQRRQARDPQYQPTSDSASVA